MQKLRGKTNLERLFSGFENNWIKYNSGKIVFEGVVGLGGFEPPTSRLSGVRSNQLSYRPPL